MKNQLITGCFILILFLSCQVESQKFHLKSLKNSSLITFESENLFPEGIVFDKKSNSFLLSSFFKGAIYRLDQQNQLSLFFKDDYLISPAALLINETKNHLYIANGDVGFSEKSNQKTTRKIAGVLIYDLVTKKRVGYKDLSNLSSKVACYANGLTIDNVGNVYVTDSHRPIVYKIDGQTNESSVFLEDENFGGSDWNLNGIAYHPKGFLMVAHMEKGILFKIDLSTKCIRKIQLNEKILGVDGITLINNNQILISQAYEIIGGKITSGALKLIETHNDWETGKIVDDKTELVVNPTNSIRIKNEIFVLNSSIGDYLFTGKNQYSYSLLKMTP